MIMFDFWNIWQSNSYYFFLNYYNKVHFSHHKINITPSPDPSSKASLKSLYYTIHANPHIMHPWHIYKKYQGWLVGCCLTSHSVIFQLYSDRTVVQFPNFDLLPGTQRHGQLGVFSVPSLPRHGNPDFQRRLFPPCHQRAHTQWG